MRVYYKFDYRGLDKIPVNVPLVLAPNHVNAFVDSILIGMTAPHKMRFFARGDVFKGGFAKWALNSLNISPMYRLQEGYSELKKNDKTFEECRQLLTANKTILLFPEAICIQERRLRPLKKGLARIVFQSAESFDFSKDILVVPIGLNYTDAKRFRSKVFIDFGEAVSAKEYEARYKEDKVKAINEFTKMFEAKMSEHMVIIQNPENDGLVAGIEEMYLQQWIEDKGKNEKNSEENYLASKDIARMVNYLDQKNHGLVDSLKQKINSYSDLLKQKHLRDHLLRPDNINKMSFTTFLLEYIKVYLGMPVYAIGLLLNYLPYFLAKKFSDTKIKNVEFYASVYGNMAMILWLLFYAIQLMIVGLVFRNWPLLALYALFVPLAGIYALRFYPMLKKITGRWRLLRMVRKDRSTIEKLVNQRAAIIEELEIAKEHYFESLKTTANN